MRVPRAQLTPRIGTKTRVRQYTWRHFAQNLDHSLSTRVSMVSIPTGRNPESNTTIARGKKKKEKKKRKRKQDLPRQCWTRDTWHTDCLIWNDGRCIMP